MGQDDFTSGAGMAAQHAPAADLSLRVAPTDGSVRYNTVRIPLVPVACWRLNDPAFAFDSSFVAPTFRDELSKLSGLLAANDGCPAALFGHCDPAGSDALNKTLGDRRAIAIYAVLTRQPALWEDLYDHAAVGDAWGTHAVQSMLASVTDATGAPYYAGPISGSYDAGTVAAVQSFQRDSGLSADGKAGPDTRRVLFGAYMDWLCTPAAGGSPFRMQPSDFLGGAGAQAGDLPKMSLQSCGKLNPIVLLTSDEMNGADQAQRNDDDAPNRRVILFLFKKGTTVDSAAWPCPKVKETNDACRAAFWSDGDARRKNGSALRLYKDTRDTMACRFYDRFARRSPCEGAQEVSGVVLVDEYEQPIVGVSVVFEGGGGSVTATTDAQGRARAPAGQGATVRVGDLSQLAAATKALQSKPPRSAPFPTGDKWAVRTPRQVSQTGVPLPAKGALSLMIVVRVDVIVSWPNGVTRDDLFVKDTTGPWTFSSGETTKFAACATGLGPQAQILSKPAADPPPPGAPVPSFPPNPVWQTPSTYFVQKGDTLEKLAATYLGDASRTGEILQADPGNAGPLTLGRSLAMPPEAVPSWVHLPSAQDAAAAAAAGGPVPWATIDVDDLHETLFEGKQSTVVLPLELTAPANNSAAWPAPLVERVLAFIVALEMALEGNPIPTNVQLPETI
jgi:hypothetical protein